MFGRIITLKANPKFNYVLRTLVVCGFMTANQAHSEIHPILFRGDSKMYSSVRFGMSSHEYKEKLRQIGNWATCHELSDNPYGEIGCDVNFAYNLTFAGVEINNALVIFKSDSLKAITGEFDSGQYNQVNSSLSDILMDQPIIRELKYETGLFSGGAKTKYSIWKYPTYMILDRQYDNANHEEKITNLGSIIEMSYPEMGGEQEFGSKVGEHAKVGDSTAKVDLDKLHIPNDLAIEEANRVAVKAKEDAQIQAELEKEDEAKKADLEARAIVKQAPSILKKMEKEYLCEAYGQAIRGEGISDVGDVPDIVKLVKSEARRRKLTFNDALVKNQRIRLGMTECQLDASWGIGEENRTVGSWGVHIQHVYNGSYVYTENGRVTSWQN